MANEIIATGRRKNSIAVVKLVKGKGRIFVNGKTLQAYIGNRPAVEMMICRPLVLTENQDKYGGQISTHTEVFFAEAIAGRSNINDDAVWNAYVSEWKSLGGDAITADVNAWYSSKR